MSVNIQVKLANLNNINQLANLFYEYCVFYNTKPNPKDCYLFIKQRLSKKDSTLLIAYSNQKMAGFLQAYPMFSSVAMQKTLLLNDLYVNQEYRGLGIAKQLILHIENIAKKENVFAIKLATQVSNKPAQKLYHSLNYQLISDFEHFSKKL